MAGVTCTCGTSTSLCPVHDAVSSARIAAIAAPFPSVEFDYPKSPSHDYDLTPKQTDLRDLIIKGLSNKEIAILIGREEKAVKSLLTRLMRKYGVTTRTELIAKHYGMR